MGPMGPPPVGLGPCTDGGDLDGRGGRGPGYLAPGTTRVTVFGVVGGGVVSGAGGRMTAVNLVEAVPRISDLRGRLLFLGRPGVVIRRGFSRLNRRKGPRLPPQVNIPDTERYPAAFLVF